jgi:excisionase family DNA binding protein
MPLLGLSATDVAEMSLEMVPALLVALAALQGAAAARLVAVPNRDAVPLAEDRLVSVAEAAKRTGMSPRWLYLHARKGDLPFARRMGRSVRFSPAGIERWLAARKS